MLPTVASFFQLRSKRVEISETLEEVESFIPDLVSTADVGSRSETRGMILPYNCKLCGKVRRRHSQARTNSSFYSSYWFDRTSLESREHGCDHQRSRSATSSLATLLVEGPLLYCVRIQVFPCLRTEFCNISSGETCGSKWRRKSANAKSTVFILESVRCRHFHSHCNIHSLAGHE